MKLKGYIKLVVMALAIMFLIVGNVSANTNWFSDVTFDCSDASTVTFNAIPTGDTEINCPGGSYFGRWSDDTTYLVINLTYSTGGGGLYPESFNSTYLGDTSNYFNNEIGANASWNENEYLKGETGTITVSFNSTNFDENSYNYFFIVVSPQGDEYINDIYSPSYSTSYTFYESGTFESYIQVYDAQTDTLIYQSDMIYHIITADTTVSFITWDKLKYKLGQTGKISYGVSSYWWDIFGYNYIEVYKDSNKIYTFDSLNDFGTLYYKFSSVGNYKLKFWNYNGITDTLLTESDIAKIEYNPSYIIMNNSIPIKTNIFVNYTLGETDSTTDLINVIEAHYLNPNDNSYVLEDSCYFNNVASTGSCIMNVDKVGTYLFTLENLRLNLLMDSEIITSYYVDNKPKNNYTASLINVTKDQWYQGDYITGNYQVKAEQFNSSEIYLNYYSVTDNYHYSFTETLLTDTGTFNNFIPGLRTGHNIVYLNYTNSTMSGNLAQKSFNVSSITSTGYGLTLSSYEVGLDEIFNIYVTIPPYPSKGKLRVVEQTYNEEVYNVTINNSMTIPQSSGIAGTYSFILSDSNNEVQVMRLLVVKSKIDNTTIKTTTAGDKYRLGEDTSNTGMITNLIILLGMPIFWGLVFIVAAIYYLRKSPNLILPVLFILINVEAVVGLLEPYTTYIVIVTWLVIAMNFIFVQKKSTG